MARKKKSIKEEVCEGLKRLAFGDITDAVTLLFADDDISNEKIKSLDLFCISEIKKARAGAMEIKFFDRQKALEKLFELSSKESNETMRFYAALEESAKSANKLFGDEPNE